MDSSSDGTQTYQQSLDEALGETFPASDPISPSAAEAGERVRSPGNAIDWRVHAGSSPAQRQDLPPALLPAVVGALVGALVGRTVARHAILGALAGAAAGVAVGRRTERRAPQPPVTA